MNEIWKDIRDFEGLYQVSDMGNVRSLDRITQRSDGTSQKSRGQVLRPGDNGRGYMQVNLYKASKVSHIAIAYLVLETFVGKRPAGMEACHNNGDNTDDRLENLRWDTHSNNQLDQIKHNTHHNANKDRCKLGHKLIEPNLRWKRNNKSKQCRACNCANAYVYRKPGIEDHSVIADKYYERIMNGKL